MSTMEEPMPAEIFEPDDGAPFTDEELDAYIEQLAAREAANDDEARFQHTQLLDTYRAHTWEIADDGAAAWAMAKLAEYADQVRGVDDRHFFMAERIAKWHTSNRKKPAERMGFFAQALEAYALAERARDPKRKTINLPSGKVRTTETGPAVAVENEEVLLAWAEGAMPAAISRKVLVSVLKEGVSLVEVPTLMVLACGCIYDPDDVGDTPDTHWAKSRVVGSEFSCHQHGAATLIGKWLETELMIMDADGDVVPGAGVKPAHVSAKAKPE